MYLKGNVTLIVRDFRKSLSFYTRTLGLSKIYESAGQWAEIDGPGITIGLHACGECEPDSCESHSISIGLVVADLESAMSALKKKGVKFWGTSEGEHVRNAWFGDPDGNPIYLCEVSQAPAKGKKAAPPLAKKPSKKKPVAKKRRAVTKRRASGR